MIKKFLIILFTIILGILSFIFAYISFKNIIDDNIKGFIIWNLCSSSAGFLASYILNIEKNFIWTEFFYSFFIPCFGGIFSWIMAIGRKSYVKKDLIKEYKNYINSKKRFIEGKISSSKFIPKPEPESLEPMADILDSDADQKEKRIAIMGLYEMHTPETIEILKENLTNSSLETRIYAAGVLERIDDNITNKLKRFENEVITNNKDKIKMEIEIAKTYFDYAYYNVADELKKRECAKKAIEYSLKAFEEEKIYEAFIVAGRSSLLLNDLDNAEKYFKKYIEKFNNDIRASLYLAETYFNKKNFIDLDKLCFKMSCCNKIPDKFKETVSLWSGNSILRNIIENGKLYE